LHNEPVEKVCY